MKQDFLFSGAKFSACGKHRFALWRLWDSEKPVAMFIGLNPSKANADEEDATIESVIRLAKFNGYGGFYMMNCWSYISTDPKQLDPSTDNISNTSWLERVSARCKDVIFAWGNFKVVKKYEKDKQMAQFFPNALCITKNKNGSPGHPLYKKGTIKFINYFDENSAPNTEA